MDTTTRHIKSLLQIAAFAAKMQLEMPVWVTERTERMRIEPYRDAQTVWVNRVYFVQEQPWFLAGQDPPVSESAPVPAAFDVRVKKVTQGSDLLIMRFDYGIGYELRTGDDGVIVYWVYPDPQHPVCGKCLSTDIYVHVDERRAFCKRHYVPASDEDFDALERAYLGRHW